VAQIATMRIRIWFAPTKSLLIVVRRMFRVSPIILTFVIARLAIVQSQAQSEEKSAEFDKYVVSRVAPEYSRDARMHRLEGAGIFQLSIDQETGHVTNVTTVKTTGWALLDRATIIAFRKWRFVPHTLGKVKIPVNFSLIGQQADQLKTARRNAIVSPAPTYPVQAWRYGVGGIGTFQLVVNYETGVVQDVRLLETTSDGRLDKAAITAFRKWRFRPRTTHTFVLRYRFF
jgi:TonB family protein